ncbi:MAG: ABC transporter ATP-binding protein, partial [Actinobacteria bacterium]|nr:ABC transporter ATP-binding protein [Actinomycetota bacterium]
MRCCVSSWSGRVSCSWRVSVRKESSVRERRWLLTAASTATDNTPVVTATSVVKTFGGLRAVDVEKLEIRRNKITALIGPNGAGKTTFFNLLTGFDKVDSGTITLDGQVITGKPPHQLAAMGMVRTFQLTKVLSKLSTIENMKLG